MLLHCSQCSFHRCSHPGSQAAVVAAGPTLLHCTQCRLHRCSHLGSRAGATAANLTLLHCTQCHLHRSHLGCTQSQAEAVVLLLAPLGLAAAVADLRLPDHHQLAQLVTPSVALLLYRQEP